MNSRTWGYAVLCVVVPVVWGLIIYWISSSIERRLKLKLPRSTSKSGGEKPEQILPLDYHI